MLLNPEFIYIHFVFQIFDVCKFLTLIPQNATPDIRSTYTRKQKMNWTLKATFLKKKNLDITNISHMPISEIDLSLSSLRLLGGPTSTIDQHPASVFRYFGVFNATQTPQKREGILSSTEPAFDRQRNPSCLNGNLPCLWGLAPPRHPIPSKAPTTRPK